MAGVELGVEAVEEQPVGPAFFDGSLGVPFACRGFVEAVEEELDVAPGEIVQKVLHNLFVGLGDGEGPHVAKVTGREAPLAWERGG